MLFELVLSRIRTKHVDRMLNFVLGALACVQAGLSGAVRSCQELFGAVWNCFELFGAVRNCVELSGDVWSCHELSGTVDCKPPVVIGALVFEQAHQNLDFGTIRIGSEFRFQGSG